MPAQSPKQLADSLLDASDFQHVDVTDYKAQLRYLTDALMERPIDAGLSPREPAWVSMDGLPQPKRRSPKIDFVFNPATYSELSRTAHSAILILTLINEKVVKPGEFAERVGCTPTAIYYELTVLEEVLPIVNYAQGKWCLLQFLDEVEAWETGKVKGDDS